MITIRHTHLDGTLVEGTTKGDGVYELIGPRTPHRFRWFPSIGMIGIPQSRDRVARRWQIDGAAEALRAAGFGVEVVIDDTPRARVDVLADQAERLDDRREALLDKAARQRGESEALWQRSHDLVKDRPLGQPILVGHHSESADRRRLERSQDLAFRALYKGDDAAQTARRADAVGTDAAYAATAGATVRRLERLRAELRDIDRKLNGYTDRWQQVHEPASGDWRESLTARRPQLVEQIGHDEAVVAAAVQAGTHRVFGPGDVQVGDAVHAHGRWHEVTKVNRVTVSVKTGYSWDDKVRYTEIRQVRHG